MSSLKPALIFQDSCVLQRQKPLCIWGTSLPEHPISITLGKESAFCNSDSSGNWDVCFPPMEACTGLQLKIQDQLTQEVLCFTDVAIGEVWIAGGQSNMEFVMRFDEDRYLELSRETNKNVRYFEVPHQAFEEDILDTSNSGIWRLCQKEQLEYFSAVGYYFARDLEESLHIPVGIVACNWGGTSALTWIPKEWIKNEPTLKRYWEAYESAVKNLDLDEYRTNFLQIRQRMNQLSKEAHYQIQHWISREDQLAFVREHALEKYGLVPTQPMGPWNQNCPGKLWDSMVLKIGKMTVRGVLWYQGESDVERHEDYHILFRTLIKAWRDLWKEELPWLFVQLPPFYKWLDQDGSNFPSIRKKQDLISQTVPNTWMVSTTDCGMKWGIHPTRKKPVGKRLCLLARGKVYGEPILCEAPQCIRAEHIGSHIRLTFLHAGDGMELHDEIQNDLYIVGDGWKTEFKQPVCRNNHVILELKKDCPPVTHVEFLNLPFGESMLYNSAGLPAKPFVIAVENGTSPH